jgi:metal-responsive CopG/Arc/MetJ family transcriptional regulator
MGRSMAGNTGIYSVAVAKVMISLPDELLERLDDHARRAGTTRSGLLRELAERELESNRTARRRRVLDLVASAAPHGGRSAAEVRKQRRAR